MLFSGKHREKNKYIYIYNHETKQNLWCVELLNIYANGGTEN